MATQSVCKIEGCDKVAAQGRKGMCLAHYKQERRHGDPLIKKKASNGEVLSYLETEVLPFQGDECLTWRYARYADGRGHIGIGGIDWTAARLVCEKVHGTPPTSKHEAAHNCGKGSEGCVNPRHLRWATRKENEADKLIHGTLTRGERHGGSKLTEADVAEIRSLRGKMLHRDLALQFGVTPSAIGLIQRGERWRPL